MEKYCLDVEKEATKVENAKTTRSALKKGQHDVPVDDALAAVLEDMLTHIDENKLTEGGHTESCKDFPNKAYKSDKHDAPFNGLTALPAYQTFCKWFAQRLWDSVF